MSKTAFRPSFQIRLLIFTYLVFLTNYSVGGPVAPPRVYGLTIDGVNNLNAITNSLVHLAKKPTTRIVFDEWQPATNYLTPATQIQTVSYIMGELLDSYYFSQYSPDQYHQRVIEYLNVLGTRVDIWEIGNEINGEWLGTTQSVVQKVSDAYSLMKAQNKRTALTLYYNRDCWENPQNEMFRWTVANVPSSMKLGLDYVLVSYYEDDCNNLQPNWQQVFDSLRAIFPNARLGIGECGTIYQNRKEAYIKRYYTMNVTTPGYIGGCFWWYYRQDCVPYTNYLWSVLNNAISGPLPGSVVSGSVSFKMGNYPNPFNPRTTIKYQLPAAAYVKMTVYDALGKLVRVLVDEWQNSGGYSVGFDGTNFSSGIYFYTLRTNDYAETKKMLLIK